MTELQISSSPRMTWIWTSDAATERRVRDVLGDASRSAYRRREVVPLVIDIGIGVDALESCEKLASAGFTFTWHESQHPLNRTDWPTRLPGMQGATSS